MAMTTPAAPRFNSVAEAAQMRLVDVVEDMLQAGYDVDAQDLDGNTALHWAASLGLEALAAQLLEAGARQDVANQRGETPAHMAAKACNLAVLGLLMLKSRQALTDRDIDGFTPFLACTEKNGAPLLEWLYLQGASLEDRDNQGRTALMLACYEGHRRTVQWLLSRSACVAATDHDGMSALHWAAVKGQDQIAKMLIDVGAISLLASPDRAGESPPMLAWRKRHWGLLLCFVKACLCQWFCGRPSITKNALAGLFGLLALYNMLIFAIFVFPQVSSAHPILTASWPLLMAAALAMWLAALGGDPGWAHARTVLPQTARIREQEEEGLLDLWRLPLEAQLARAADLDATLQSQLGRLEGEKDGGEGACGGGGHGEEQEEDDDEDGFDEEDEDGEDGEGEDDDHGASHPRPRGQGEMRESGEDMVYVPARPRPPRMEAQAQGRHREGREDVQERPEVARGDRSRLARLEGLQRRIAHQQQLIALARRALEERRGLRKQLPRFSAAPVKGELQPLMAAVDLEADLRPGAPGCSPFGSPLGLHRTGGLGFAIDEAVAEADLGRFAARLAPASRRAADLLQVARRADHRRRGREDYLQCVQVGDFRHLCVICHAKRAMRAYHCKECGRCVHRLDHHCPWIDNCVGLRNQRLFYLFLTVLLASLGILMALAVASITEAAEFGPGSIFSLAQLAKLLSPRWASLRALVVFATLGLDCVWVFFVGSLLVRQTAYMLVNITTYEVLICPPHVQRRFPSRGRRFWYLADLSFAHALQSLWSYWTLDTTHDAKDFFVLDGENITTVVEAMSPMPHDCGIGGLGGQDTDWPPVGGMDCAELCGNEFAQPDGLKGVLSGSSPPYVAGRLRSAPGRCGAGSGLGSRQTRPSNGSWEGHGASGAAVTSSSGSSRRRSRDLLVPNHVFRGL